MRKRIIAILLAAVSAAALLAGCAKNDTTSDNKSKDSVVVAITTEPETLDPCQGWGHGNMPMIQSTLVKYGSDMSFKNDLATGYELSPDGLEWTFTLREDVKFTDGEALTASDVVFTFNTAKAAGSSVDLSFMEKVEAEGDYTVKVTLSKPTSVFLNTVASIGIVPEHAYGPDYGVNPIGSGPFKFVQWNKQEQLMLAANEDYYGAVPTMKKITIVFMSEDAALAAVKAGQVDVAQSSATLADTAVAGYSIKNVSTIDNRGFTLPTTPAEGKLSVSGYPVGNDVTCNIEIRHAIAYALDREMVAEMALNGYATPCYSENDGMPWNNPEVKIETNVEYAKQLLADAGWADTDGDGIVEKDGLKAEFGCVYPSGDSGRQAIAMAAAQQLREIGISVIVEGTSWDEISKRMFSEAVMMGWGAANPYESYCLYHSAGGLKDDYYNPEGYASETTDGYLSAAMEAITVEDAYKNWQLAQWDGETGTAMKGECPWVWIVNVDHIYFVRDGLDIGEQRLHPHGASMPLIQNLQDWKWS